MKWFNRLSVNKKLIMGFAIVLLFFIVVSLLSIFSMNNIGDKAKGVQEVQVPSLFNLQEMHGHAITYQRLLLRANSVQEQSERERLLTKVTANADEYNTHDTAYQALPATDNEKALYEKLRENVSTYFAKMQDSAALLKNGDSVGSQRVISENNTLFNEIESQFDELTDIQLVDTNKQVKLAVSTAKNSGMYVIIVTTISFIVAIFMMIVISRQVRQALGSVLKNSEHMLVSATEVSEIVAQTFVSVDALDHSTQNVQTSIEEMVVSISQTAGNADNTASSVEEISAAVEEMSRSITGVAESAVSLNQATDQASSAIAQLAVSIEQVSNNTVTVSQAANIAQQEAMTGKLQLEETISGMREIATVVAHASDVMSSLGKSSEEIGSIIEVIDDIADQTNLLALNAAIEAARAGDHGKGFAVVADEVRKLAERSAKATKEITTLIEGIQKESSTAIAAIDSGNAKVEAGSHLATKTHEAMVQIVSSIAQISNEMSHISLATSEQSNGTKQIVDAVENVSSQATRVMQATKEQALGAEEIVRGISHARDQVQQIRVATQEQSKHGHDVSNEMKSVSMQAKDVHAGAQIQKTKTADIVDSVSHVTDEVSRLT